MFDFNNDLGLLIHSGNVRCTPVKLNEEGRLAPFKHKWGEKEFSYVYSDLPDEFKPLGKFAICCNSFHNLSSIDIDVSKESDLSCLTQIEMDTRSIILETCSGSLIEKSTSNNGSCHIYVLDDLSIFDKYAWESVSGNLEVEIFVNRNNGGSGLCIVPTLDLVNSTRIIHVDNIINILDSLHFNKIIKNDANKDQFFDRILHILPEYGDVKKALGYISNADKENLGHDYVVTRIGFALHAATGGSEEGFKLWIEWLAQNKTKCKKRPNHESRMAGKWNSFTDPVEREKASITEKTLFKEAIGEGYRSETQVIQIKSKLFPPVPKYCEIIPHVCSSTDLPLSMSAYTHACVLSGVLGRAVRYRVEGEPELGTISFMGMLQAPSGAGKNKLMKPYRDPVSNIVYGMMSDYEDELYIYKLDNEKYKKNLKNSPSNLELRKQRPVRPINPKMLLTNPTINSLRKRIGLISGSLMIMTTEMKEMYGHAMKNIEDVVGFLANLYSGDANEKTTGVEDKDGNSYTTNPHSSLAMILMDQGRTLDSLMRDPNVSEDGMVGRSFIEKISLGYSKPLDGMGGYDKNSGYYLRYVDYVTDCMRGSHAMASKYMVPSVVTIGGKALDMLVGFKLRIQAMREDSAHKANHVDSMLIRSYENACHVFVSYCCHHIYCRDFYRKKFSPEFAAKINGMTLEDEEISHYAIGMCEYNLIRNADYAIKNIAYKRDRNLYIEEAIIEGIRKSNARILIPNRLVSFAGIARTIPDECRNATALVKNIMVDCCGKYPDIIEYVDGNFINKLL